MFKFLNLIVTIILVYDFINKTSSLSSAVLVDNYSMIAFSSVWLLIDAIFLIAIYITVFGGSEIYVTTQSFSKKEEEGQKKETGNVGRS